MEAECAASPATLQRLFSGSEREAEACLSSVPQPGLLLVMPLKKTPKKRHVILQREREKPGESDGGGYVKWKVCAVR